MAEIETVVLPNGYNGHTERFKLPPVDTNGNSVKVMVATPGREYMFRWIQKDKLQEAIEAQRERPANIRTIYTREELKDRAAREFRDGDIIEVGKYIINIGYGEYRAPLRTWVHTVDGKILDCWPAGARGACPYYINDFVGRLPK
ncbi:MAG: hypothetical protein FOGNACKC_00871 [Anaerolineae bacterium]|nr:hypothetical protein [Anaerolineae bacterium]